MKRICVVTAARSEYSALKWIMHEISNSSLLEMQLVVTGGHLLESQGKTISEIIKDGFEPDRIIDCSLDNTSKAELAKYMGRLAERFAVVFDELKPDYLLVAGDRYELLPVCNSAFIMEIPIIHISGGDITKGAIDNNIRNAISMLATYHFPGTASSELNLRKMLGDEASVWCVGEPTLDAYNNEILLSRQELSEELHLDIKKKWVLFTYHAETKNNISEDIVTVKNCFNTLTKLDNIQVIATYSNADFGGDILNQEIEKQGELYPKIITVIPSLGHIRYLSMMKQVRLVIGNSSSGIIEAPFVKVPAVNIGGRQLGRHLCSNIIQCKKDKESITQSIKYALNIRFDIVDSLYWGDGNSAKKIVNILEKFVV